MSIRLVLRSPGGSAILEILKLNQETNEVSVRFWGSDQIYTMPYDPEGWKEKGWVRSKVNDEE